MTGISSPLAPARINYAAWHTGKNTRNAASKLLEFGRLIDEGSFARYGGRAEAVVREYWKEEMPYHQQLCNHNSRETIASWSFEVKTEFLAGWGNLRESTHVSPLPFMVISQLGKKMQETGKSSGNPPQGPVLQEFVQTAIKPIFEAMAKNLLNFAGVKEAA